MEISSIARMQSPFQIRLTVVGLQIRFVDVLDR